MKPVSLHEIYAHKLAARAVEGHLEEHRQRVMQALAPHEMIFDFWWDPDFTGLVLATDRRLLQFPKTRIRRGILAFDVVFETLVYPYEEIDGLSRVPGSLFEFTRIRLHRKHQDDALIVITKLRRERLDEFVANIQALLEQWAARQQAQEMGETPQERPQEAEDLTARLKALYDLYQSGALSHEEYQQAKRKLLEE